MTLKPEVNDPAGQTVLAALRRMGHTDAQDARIGKYLELQVDGKAKQAVEESVELAIPAPVITLSLQQRFRSRQDQPLGGKVLAALRGSAIVAAQRLTGKFAIQSCRAFDDVLKCELRRSG